MTNQEALSTLFMLAIAGAVEELDPARLDQVIEANGQLALALGVSPLPVSPSPSVQTAPCTTCLQPLRPEDARSGFNHPACSGELPAGGPPHGLLTRPMDWPVR